MQIQTFTNNGFSIRGGIDEQGRPYFIANDICNALDIQNSRDAINTLDDDELMSVKATSGGQIREMNAVTESGLYTLIFKSRKPEAKKFRKWVTSEVLPSIRKNGHYAEIQQQFNQQIEIRRNTLEKNRLQALNDLQLETIKAYKTYKSKESNDSSVEKGFLDFINDISETLSSAITKIDSKKEEEKPMTIIEVEIQDVVYTLRLSNKEDSGNPNRKSNILELVAVNKKQQVRQVMQFSDIMALRALLGKLSNVEIKELIEEAKESDKNRIGIF